VVREPPQSVAQALPTALAAFALAAGATSGAPAGVPAGVTVGPGSPPPAWAASLAKGRPPAGGFPAVPASCCPASARLTPADPSGLGRPVASLGRGPLGGPAGPVDWVGPVAHQPAPPPPA
jgi:hypothetical protein